MKKLILPQTKRNDTIETDKADITKGILAYDKNGVLVGVVTKIRFSNNISINYFDGSTGADYKSLEHLVSEIPNYTFRQMY